MSSDPIRLGPPGLPPPRLTQPAPSGTVVSPFGGRSPLAGVADAPDGVPLILVKDADGILRPRQLDPVDVGDHTHPDPWGDRVQFRPGPPTPDPTAPEGAVHIDTTTGRGYRLRNLEET